MLLSAVGRGGEGDVGQRIRDEILVIQVKANAPKKLSTTFYLLLHETFGLSIKFACWFVEK